MSLRHKWLPLLLLGALTIYTVMMVIFVDIIIRFQVRDTIGLLLLGCLYGLMLMKAYLLNFPFPARGDSARLTCGDFLPSQLDDHRPVIAHPPAEAGVKTRGSTIGLRLIGSIADHAYRLRPHRPRALRLWVKALRQ